MLIGIFGGTFDPPHNGHKKLALEFTEKFRPGKLLIIPTYIPPHKVRSGGADCNDRLNMARLMFSDIKEAEISDVETERGGKSYTADTVTQLKEMYPDDELMFIMGSDMLFTFHLWYKPEVILSCCRICAVSRCKDISTDDLKKYVYEYFPDNTDRFEFCDFEPWEMSSTDLRCLAENNEISELYTCAGVIDYIREKELYR